MPRGALKPYAQDFFKPPRAYHVLTYLRFQKTGVSKEPPRIPFWLNLRRLSALLYFSERNVPITADWLLLLISLFEIANRPDPNQKWRN